MRWLGVLAALIGGAALVVDVGTPAAQTTKPAPAATKPSADAQARQLSLSMKPWTGDFDKMLERRMVRVLVPYSRTLYYSDKGRERGVTGELVREWERWVNRKFAKQLGRRPLTVYIIPTTRDKLISGLVDGHGDIAAGNITVTDDRLKVVDFVAPSDVKPVDEIVVAGPSAPAVTSVDGLSGKTVHVRKASSHYESLVALNARFAREGKPPLTVALLPDALESEDILEMANAGLLQLVIVDDWLAGIWAQLLPSLKLIPQAAVRTGGRVGWAIRKDSPRLRAVLDEASATLVKKQNLVGYLRAQQGRRLKELKNNTADADLKRFQEMLALFRKYGGQYNFDPLMLAAQGYQESQLNQAARSRVGAIGVMQVMPATGAELKVGDIRVTEANIHAGAKYLDRLMTKYFPDASFSEGNRPLFAFAAYNAGPGNVSKMRRLAGQRGLDPDKWFNHVEIVTAEKIGIETTTYVRNIYKYYTAYRLTLEHEQLRQQMKEQIKKGS